MELNIDEDELLKKVNNYTKKLYEILEEYDKKKITPEKLWESFETVNKDLNWQKICEDYDREYGDTLVWSCPCCHKGFNKRLFEDNYFKYLTAKKRVMHDAFLFCTMARDRFQAISGYFPFQQDTIEIVKSDEPRIHMKVILKRMNEKLKKFPPHKTPFLDGVEKNY